MTVLKLTRIGDSIGVVIPKDMLARLNIKKGDRLSAVETAEGGLHLMPFDPAFAANMENAEDIMRRYRNTLNVLAK